MRRAIIPDSPSSWSRILGSVNAKPLTAPCPRRSSFLKGREVLVLFCKQEGHSCWRACCHLWIFGIVYLQHIFEGNIYRHWRPFATSQATEPMTIWLTSRDLAHSSKLSSGYLVGTKEHQGATILRHDHQDPQLHDQDSQSHRLSNFTVAGSWARQDHSSLPSWVAASAEVSGDPAGD